MRITVVGCGNGAFATAADLTLKGHTVTLYADFSHEKTLSSVMKTKVIKVSGNGPAGDVVIHEVTCDEAVAFADEELIIVCVPAFALVDVAERIAPYIHDGEKILLSPGGIGGSLIFADILSRLSDAKYLRTGEFHTLPYTVRKTCGDGVNILLMVKYLMFAAFPAVYNDEMFETVRQLYPAAVQVTDVLETGLNNGNLTTHPAPMVLNAGKIEYYGRHNHYAEGITPSVAHVVQLIDDERKAICRALGYEEIDIKDRLYRMGYCPEADTVYDSIRGSKEAFLQVKGPNDLGSRYLTEDTPYGLVAASHLARLAGVETPLIDSVIHLASALMRTDYMKSGRTVEEMGMGNMTVSEIKYFLQNGRTVPRR